MLMRESFRRLVAHPAFVLGLTLALSVRLFFGLPSTLGYEPRTGDAAQYVELADSILAGKGLARLWFADPQTVVPTAQRSPGYPLFLAGVFRYFGRDFSAVVWAQALLDTGTCLLLSLLAASLFGTAAGLFALWWAALDPSLWIHVSRLWTECLFVAQTALLFYVLDLTSRRPRTALAPWVGAILGAMWLTRPNGWLFVPVAALSLALAFPRGARLRSLVAMGAVLVVLVTPWIVRNWAHFGRFIPVSTQTWVVLAGSYNDFVLEDPLHEGRWATVEILPLAEVAPTEVEAIDAMREKAIGWIVQNPSKLPRLAWLRVRALWDPWWSRWEIPAIWSRPMLAELGQFFYVITAFLAIVGLWLARDRLPRASYLVTVPVLFTIFAALTWGNWRLRAPVEPVLVVLASAIFRERQPSHVAARQSSDTADH